MSEAWVLPRKVPRAPPPLCFVVQILGNGQTENKREAMSESKMSRERLRAEMRERRGFVLPVIVFGLLVMSTMAVAMLLTSSDENRSARAMREGSAAFYAAEAGLNQVYANWDSAFHAQVDSIAPGDSLVLDWTALTGGSQYRAVVHRWHDSGQPVYELTVEGRGPGAQSGQRMLSYMLTADATAGYHLQFGSCCSAAVTMRGKADIDDFSRLDGHDAHPPGWEDFCYNDLHHKPGLLMKDSTQITIDPNATLDGVPPLKQGSSLSDTDFEYFSGFTWQEIAAKASKIFHDGEFTPRPSTTVDPMTGELICNTSDPLNLGSDDPNHPCFDYFPLVVISDDVTFENGYAQGIFVLKVMPTGWGSEFDLEGNHEMNGLIIGKGCVEPEVSSDFHGAIFVDSKYRNLDICNTDMDYDMNDGDPLVHYSTCAVDRALVGTGLDEWAVAQEPGTPTGVQLLSSRGFGEVLR